MKIREVIDALESFAPLPLQEEYDNSGLQVGTTESEVSGALLCLDVTMDVVREAAQSGCNLVISHHPLLFRPLRKLTDDCIGSIVMEAVRNGITLYACHTNLDNAPLGVNMKIAQTIGLEEIKPLDACGVIGLLPEPVTEQQLLEMIAVKFGVKCIRHNGALGRPVQSLAVCGGAGAFLIEKAVELKADAFMTGEIGYHRFFGYDGTIKLIETGHFESEQYTVDLIHDILSNEFPSLKIVRTGVATNPVNYYIS